MRYADIRKTDISNGEGIGVSLFVQGCHFHCKNCFNPQTWDFEGGKEFTENEFNMILSLMDRAYINHFSILGGEPLEENNLLELGRLVIEIRTRFPQKKIWLWSGFKWEDIRDGMSYHEYTNEDTVRNERALLMRYIDYLVDGQYIDELKDYTLSWRGSSNQRVIDVVKTIQIGHVVEVEHE